MTASSVVLSLVAIAAVGGAAYCFLEKLDAESRHETAAANLDELYRQLDVAKSDLERVRREEGTLSAESEGRRKDLARAKVDLEAMKVDAIAAAARDRAAEARIAALLASLADSRRLGSKSVAPGKPADDRAPAPAATKEATGSVAGKAFKVRDGGGVVKAAGRTVLLVPVEGEGSPYFAGVVEKGYPYDEKDHLLRAEVLKTTADEEGAFAFKGVAAGEYRVASYVVWMSGSGLKAGGWAALRVSVDGGSDLHVVVTDQP